MQYQSYANHLNLIVFHPALIWRKNSLKSVTVTPRAYCKGQARCHTGGEEEDISFNCRLSRDK